MDKATILVVEDDMHLMEGISDILRMYDYGVLTAYNGVEGLEVIRSQPRPPDLIMSDIMMPRMDGYEFFEAVRSETAWVAIPFIFLTAKGEREDIQRGKRMGAEDYIVKPFDADELLVAIAGRLQRRNRLSEVYQVEFHDLQQNALLSLGGELRKSLTYATAYVDMLHQLLHQDPAQLTARELDQRTRVVETGRIRFRQMVEKLLTLLDIVSGEAQDTYVWRKTPTADFESLTRRIEENFQAMAEKQQVRLVTEIEHGLPAVMADTEYLYIALDCMVDNAIKFSDKPGLAVTIRVFAENDKVHFAVMDQGCGLPADRLEVIFDLPDPRRSEGETAGFGLAIVSGVVQLHGGAISVESHDGQGSIFTISIPAMEPEPPAVEPEQPVHRAHETAPRSAESIGQRATREHDRSPARAARRVRPTQPVLLLAHASSQLAEDDRAKLSNAFALHMLESSEFDSIRRKIAELQPQAIVLMAPEIGPDLLHTLNGLWYFDLSMMIPKIIMLQVPPSPDQWRMLIDSGADEICCPAGDEIVASLRASMDQYDDPEFIGAPDRDWQAIVVSKDKPLQQAVGDVLKANSFAVNVVSRAGKCRAAVNKHAPDYLVVDSNLCDLDCIRAWRTEGVQTPIILIDTHLSPAVFEQLHRLNIRGFLSSPFDAQHLESVFQRLKRRQKKLMLDDIWRHYQLAVQELRFEIEVRETSEQLGAMLAEMTAHNGGFVHDLRGSLASLDMLRTALANDNADEPTQKTLGALQEAREYAAFLLETIADMRFKGTWKPRICSNNEAQEVLAGLFDKTLAMVHYARPEADVHGLQVPEAEALRLIVEPAQILHALAALLIASIDIGESKTLATHVHVADDSLVIALNKPEWSAATLNQYITLKRVTLGSLNRIFLMVARRIARRHCGDLSVDGAQLVFTLPMHNLPRSPTLRAQIAALADEQDRLRARLHDLPPVTDDIQTTPILAKPVHSLVREWVKISSLARELGDKGQRLFVVAHFAALLARNLLIISIQVEPEVSVIRLEAVFNTLYQLRKDHLKDRMTTHVEPGTPAILSDGLALLQILVNLVNNAFEALEEGVGMISVAAQPSPEGVQITVADTGSGIPEEDQKKIFDLYYTTKEGHERGVGLHIVRSLVEQLGGSIHVESVMGQGTTFTIILPKGQ